ncbi:GL26512 [Drosophila persimilis]|uniref:GL26512 n=1 Tax=Drosophila persimilis TaxID=7234 RepID=B4GSD4_DROPE|nr:GL26512 [Drosophila persimilis]
MHAKRITHKPRRHTIESEEIEDAEEEEQFFDYEDYFEYFGEEVSVESEFSLAVESSSSETKRKTLVSISPSKHGTDSQFSMKRTTVASFSILEKVGQMRHFAHSRHDTTRTHFIDVGSLTFGAIFGLGEKMEHRVIMARTVVQCLVLPRFWLLEEELNPGNIWQRRRFYLECSAPSRKKIREQRGKAKFRKAQDSFGLQCG